MTVRTTIRIVGLVLLTLGHLPLLWEDQLSSIANWSELAVEVSWFVMLILSGALVSFTQPSSWGKYRAIGWIPFLLLCFWVIVFTLHYSGFLGPCQLGSSASWLIVISVSFVSPLGLFCYLMLGIFSFLPLTEDFAAGQTHCIKCGYDLRGLTEPHCPECGTPFGPKQNEEQSEGSASVTSGDQNRP